MKGLWMCLILIGIGAFLISFNFEFIFFKNLMGSPEFAFCLTAVLECAKVFMVIFHRFVSDTKNYTIPDVVRSLNTWFKISLVLLSVICSIAIISRNMDRPNMEQVKNGDKEVIDTAFKENNAILQQQRNSRLEKITSEIAGKYKDRYQRLAEYYEPRIDAEETLRDKEFKRVINGVRKGPMWHEHDRKIKELTEEYRFEKYELRKSENEELNSQVTAIENEFQEKIDAISKKREDAQSATDANDYLEDDRAKNEIIASFLMTLEKGLDIELEYLTFGLLMSLLISILLESIIYLTFNYVVMFYNNHLRKTDAKALNQEVPFEQYTPKNEHTHRDQAEQDISESQERGQGGSIEELLRGKIRQFQNQFKGNNGPSDDYIDPCSEKEIRDEQ